VIQGTTRVVVTTPLGMLEIVAAHDGVVSSRFVAVGEPRRAAGPRRVPAGGRALVVAGRFRHQVAEYVAGRRRSFEPLLIAGLPAGPAASFPAVVRGVVARIPAGETRTYADVAAAAGSPGAARAVGRIMASNPWCLLIPCHRVVRRDGALGGFRGGTAVKEALLAHEAATWGREGELRDLRQADLLPRE